MATQMRENKWVMSGLKAIATKDPRRIVFPEHDDPRVVEAIRYLASKKLCTPVILSTNSVIDSIPGIEVFSRDPLKSYWMEKAEILYMRHQHKLNLSTQQVKHALEDPLLKASLLVSSGYVDGGVAGSVATTADVLRAAIRGIGLSPGSSLVSSVFLMEWPDKVFSFGDCAVNPAPNAEQLAQIAIDSAITHQKLTGEQPRVALLSFSTKGSANHDRIDVVREAFQIIKVRSPSLIVDGELQFDAAYLPAIAAIKSAGSPVAGMANVYIFPDLSSGNIGYKIAERMGGATAIGPVLQGLAKPWLDLSRGCKTSDIVDAAVIASILSMQD